MIRKEPTSSNEIQAPASCGFYCPGQGHNLLFILGRKCILAVVAFIIESSVPESHFHGFVSWFNRMLCFTLFKISSTENRHAVNTAVSHHNYSKVSPGHKCILM